MAEKQSREGKWTTLECMRCGHRETFTELQFKTTDGLSCEMCEGPVIPSKTKPGEPVRNRRMKKQKSEKTSLGKGLSVKLDLDVSDALKGLKAVQREAKKTARILKKVEERRDIKDLSDDEILDELSSRGWDVEDASFHAGSSEEPLFRSVQLNKNNDKTGG